MENYKLIKLNQDGSLDCWREDEPISSFHLEEWLESKETFPCASKIDLSEIESCFKVWEEYPINVTDLVEIREVDNCEHPKCDCPKGYCLPDKIERYSKVGYFKSKSDESLEDSTLIDDLFALWEDLSLAGEISIGIGFSKKYIDMKERIQKFKRK